MQTNNLINVIKILLLATLLSVGLMACATQQTKTSAPDQPSAEKAEVPKEMMDPPLAKSFNRIIVDEITTATPELQTDYQQQIIECRDALISSLQANPRFQCFDGQKLEQAAEDGTLLLKMRLTSMRVVSSTARFWGGAMAGSSYVNMDLEFVDAANQTVLRKKEFSSYNNPFGATYRSTDKTLASDVGKILAAYIDSIIPK